MGYIGLSRSERSQNAIEWFEVPLSMINKELIGKFLEEYKEEYTEEQLKKYRNISIPVIKHIAKYKVGRSSWHHTSAMYNETNHYSLEEVFNHIEEIGVNEAENIYKDFKLREEKEKEEDKKRYTYITVEFAIFGRKNGKFKHLYNETRSGICVANEWVYYYEYLHEHKTLKKFKKYGSAVKNYEEEKSYKELVKKHKESKGKVKIFNNIIKELKGRGTIL